MTPTSFSDPSSRPLYFFFFSSNPESSFATPPFPRDILQILCRREANSTAHVQRLFASSLFNLSLLFVGSKRFPSLSFFRLFSARLPTHYSSALDSPKSPGDIQGRKGPAAGSCLYVHDDAHHRDGSEEGSYRPEESGDCERRAVSAIVLFALWFCVLFWSVQSVMHVKDQVFLHPSRLVADDRGGSTSGRDGCRIGYAFKDGVLVEIGQFFFCVKNIG